MAFRHETKPTKSRFRGGLKSQPEPFNPPIPGPFDVGPFKQNVSGSTPTFGSGESGVGRFLGGLAGAPLRSGLQIGLDVQNIATKEMPPSINPREDLGPYAAFFLGDEPINALSSDVQAAIAGGAESGGKSNANSLLNTIGVTGGAALNLFPLYGSLGRAGASLLTRKFTTKVVEDLSRPGEVNVRRFKDILIKNQGQERQVNINTPYTPDNQLPVIDYGKPTKSELPTIQTEATTPKAGGYTYVPIGKGLEVPVKTTSTQLKPLFSPTTRAPQLTGSISKAAADIKAEAVARGFNEIPEGQLARYTPITKLDQERRVTDLLTANEPEARRMALGQAPIPAGTDSQVLFNAVKRLAMRTNDGELLRSLARSPLATERSLAAQKLGAAGFDNSFNDPLKAIQDIENTRKTFNTKGVSVAKQIQATKTQIRDTISKTAPNNWDEFIDSITC